MTVTTGTAEAEKPPSARAWWAFAFYLPGEAASARVKIWRRLQDIGAASFKKALYLLPANQETLEDLEWTMKEVTAAGGHGVILEAKVIEGLNDGEIAALFDAAREAQYRELADEVRKVSAAQERPRGRATASDLSNQVIRFRERLSAIEAIDFFQANGREQTQALIDALDERANAQLSLAGDSAEGVDPKAELLGRTWVTRANIHVDRMASAWLIKRSIDPAARFKFVADRHYKPAPGELRFDMYAAEYTHDADRCTFEVLLDLIDPLDEGVTRIAEIVHDLDIRDRKFQRPETAGIKVLLDGLVANHDSDEDRMARANALFEDLHKSYMKGSRG
jgi:hypothetical protein